MDHQSVFPDVPDQVVYVCTCCGMVQILAPAVVYPIPICYLSLFERSHANPFVRVSTDLRLGWDEPDPRSVTPRSPGYVHNVDLNLHLSSFRPVYPDLSRFAPRFGPDGQRLDDPDLDLSLKL